MLFDLWGHVVTAINILKFIYYICEIYLDTEFLNYFKYDE